MNAKLIVTNLMFWSSLSGSLQAAPKLTCTQMHRYVPHQLRVDDMGEAWKFTYSYNPGLDGVDELAHLLGADLRIGALAVVIAKDQCEWEEARAPHVGPVVNCVALQGELILLMSPYDLSPPHEVVRTKTGGVRLQMSQHAVREVPNTSMLRHENYLDLHVSYQSGTEPYVFNQKFDFCK